MDAAYISAIAALAGSTVGGLTSLVTSLLTHRGEFRAQQLSHSFTRREELYRDFIVEASRLYADAFGTNDTQPAKLVPLVTQLGLMRILSSSDVVESADRVVRTIVETYQAPNRTFHDMLEFLNSDSVNPLREFSVACRAELRR